MKTSSHSKKESGLKRRLKGVGGGLARGILYGTIGNLVIPTSLVEIIYGIKEYKKGDVEEFYSQATKIPLALVGHIYTGMHLTNHLINRDWGNVNLLDILLVGGNLFSLLGIEFYPNRKKETD